MNDKDKEAFEKWYEDQKYWYDSWEDNYMQDGFIVSLPGETEQAWQAACEYKKEVFDAYVRRDEMIKSIEAENKKLREALESITLYILPCDMLDKAREALKEVEDK